MLILATNGRLSFMLHMVGKAMDPAKVAIGSSHSWLMVIAILVIGFFHVWLWFQPSNKSYNNQFDIFTTQTAAN